MRLPQCIFKFQTCVKFYLRCGKPFREPHISHATMRAGARRVRLVLLKDMLSQARPTRIRRARGLEFINCFQAGTAAIHL